MNQLKLLIILLIFFVVNSCQKIEISSQIAKNETNELVNNLKEYAIKRNGIYEKHALDSLLTLINYNEIEIKAIDSNQKFFLLKIKSDSSEYLGIIQSKSSIETIGIIRTENIPKSIFINEIYSTILSKRLTKGYIIQIYDIHNVWIKKYEGLSENIIKETSIFKKYPQGLNGTNKKTLNCYAYYLNVFVDGVLVSSTFLGFSCDGTGPSSDIPNPDGSSSNKPELNINKDPCQLAKDHKKMFDSLQNSSDYTNKLNIISQSGSVEKTTTFGRNSNGQIISTSIVSGNSGSATPNFNISSPFALLHSHPNVSPPSTGDFYNLAKNANKYPSLTSSITIDASGNIYSLLIVDRDKLETFLTNNPGTTPPGSNGPTFPLIIANDQLNIQDAIVRDGFENNEAYAMAFSFILDKYNTGVELLKSNNGNFEPIIIITQNQINFSILKCPQ